MSFELPVFRICRRKHFCMDGIEIRNRGGFRQILALPETVILPFTILSLQPVRNAPTGMRVMKQDVGVQNSQDSDS